MKYEDKSKEELIKELLETQKELEIMKARYTNDITEQKLAEDTLFNERLVLRTLIDNIPDSVYTKDLLTRKTLSNLADLQHIGKTKEAEVLGKTDFDLFPYDIACRFFADDQSVLQTGIPVINREEYFLDGNQEKRWLLTTKLPLHNSQGEIIGLIGIGRDITERKQADEEIELKTKKLILANANKDRFITILAHDLRNPFHALLGLSELLLDNIHSFSIEKIEYFVSNIYVSSKSTYSLLEELLMWAKAQLGKLPFEPKVINFSTVCTATVDLLQLNANAKNITINYLKDQQLEVFADVNMLQTVLRNLISNAIKFTNLDGHIVISAEKSGNETTISISDNGIGMTPEDVAKLFDISQTYTTEGTAQEKGTGLGLLLCKEFVEKLGGKISVESMEGIGSNFKFTLPS